MSGNKAALLERLKASAPVAAVQNAADSAREASAAALPTSSPAEPSDGISTNNSPHESRQTPHKLHQHSPVTADKQCAAGSLDETPEKSTPASLNASSPAHASMLTSATAQLSMPTLMSSHKRAHNSASVQQDKRPRMSVPVKAVSKLAGAPKFQALLPLRPDVAAGSVALTATSSSQIPVQAARTPLLLDNIIVEYAWLPPIMGHQAFHDFLPGSIASDSLQAVLAYLLTRAYCKLGLDESETVAQVSRTIPCITSVDYLVAGVFRIVFADDNQHVFLAATGEIISSTGDLRTDWNNFLAANAPSAGENTGQSLLHLVKSQDDDAYEHGISKAFRSRLAAMHDRPLASELLAIAESYVLAHVAVSDFVTAVH